MLAKALTKLKSRVSVPQGRVLLLRRWRLMRLRRI